MMMATGQDFSQILHEQLLCYICESGLKAGKHHWYRCTQGHMVCHDCKEIKEKKNCSCKKPLLSEPCTLIKALLRVNKMEFKCENFTRGCQKLLDAENMTFHHAECLYRLVRCPRPTTRSSCESKIPFHELLDHMKPFCLLGEGCYGLYNEFAYDFVREGVDGGHFLPKKIVAENKIFFSTIKRMGGVVYHWIHFYGSPIEAKNYSYTLEYYNDTKTPKVTCSFSDQVVSIDETVDSIIESGNCFSISRKVLKNKFFQQKDEEKDKFLVKFSIKIGNLKEEVKDENVESGVSDIDE